MSRTFGWMLAIAIAAGTGNASAACTIPDGFDLTTEDRGRIRALEEARLQGLSEAEQTEAVADWEVVYALFDAEFLAPDPAAIAGDYQCRTIKLGGISPVVVYSWFRCRISPEEQAFVVEKVTGSQNFTGLLVPAGGGYLYRGAGHYSDESPRPYGADPERNQVGCLSSVPDGEQHFVLELPRPKFESVHDVIEFRPR